MSFDNFQNDQNQNENQNGFNQNEANGQNSYQHYQPNGDNEQQGYQNGGYQNYNPNANEQQGYQNGGYQNYNPNGNQGYYGNYQGGYQNYQPYHFPQKRASSFDTASLSCGIASLVLCCCTYLSIALGILGVVFAFVGRKHSGKMSGMALAGLICGVVGALLGAVSIAVTLAMGDYWEELLKNFPFDTQGGSGTSGTSSFDM